MITQNPVEEEALGFFPFIDWFLSAVTNYSLPSKSPGFSKPWCPHLYIGVDITCFVQGLMR